MEQIEGTLSVSVGKKGKIFTAKFAGKKGPATQSIFPQAMYFNQSEAADGDPILIERDGGQIKKVTIQGKPECQPEARPQPPQRPVGARTQGPAYDRRPSSRPFDGHQAAMRQGPRPSIPPATAPYNFIEQTCVLEAPKLGREERYSGVFVCKLATLTPMMIGGPQGRVRDQNMASAKKFMSVDGHYVIPGSSLKGLLRSCVEILSCSGIHALNNRRIFMRNFSEAHYKTVFGIGQGEQSQKAGYLVRRGAEFEIIPVSYTPVPLGSGYTPGKTRVCTGPIVRKNHDYDFDSFQGHEHDQGMPVPDSVLDDFILQLTPAQEQTLRRYKINGADGIRSMTVPLPVFYLESGGSINFFGLARFFRYPSRYTTGDLCNYTMKPLPEGVPDFAMQLFGFARGDKSLSGRVSVTASFFGADTQARTSPPMVLSRPHPSCVAHYLKQNPDKMQTLPRNPNSWDINSMNNYNELCEVRGRKCYWHRDLDIPPVNPKTVRSQSILEPIESGAEAEFKVCLAGVSLIELGALVEALFLPEGHAHKFGMGKSFGLGSVRIDLKSSDIRPCRERYGDIEKRCHDFFSNASQKNDDQSELLNKAREAFQQWLLSALEKKGKQYKDYRSIPHIRSFNRMTDFAHKPDKSKTCYMDLKEFRALRVLPGPLEVV